MSGISHDMNYVGWVQRSLNRITGAGIKTDGQISTLYRMWVMEFQYGVGCSTRDGSVDKPTQQALIKNNLCGSMASKVYLIWVQQALTRVFNTKVAVAPTGGLNKETIEAVKTFQDLMGHKHIDGVIGPKTELDLIRQVPDLIVPGFYPGHSMPPPDPLDEKKDDWLETHNDARGIDQRIDNWTNIFAEELRHTPGNIPDPVRREVTKCMMKKIQLGVYDYAYLSKEGAFKVAQGHGESGKTADEVGIPDLPDSEYKEDLPVSKFTLDARDTLRFKIGKFSNNMPSKALFKQYKTALKELYVEIDKGIKMIKYQEHTGGIKAGSYKKLDNWYLEKLADSRSIISCFPK